MTKNVIIYFVLIILPYFSIAQTKSFSSKIVNYENKGIEGVGIRLTNKDSSSIISFSFSDSQGNFKLNYPNDNSELLLIFTSLNYQDTIIQLNKIIHKTTIKLKQKYFNIDEVKIISKYNPITFNKDTIVYNVSAFATSKESNIGSVIAKMPGFDVTNSGLIRYQGKAIDKFYIEGLDLLEGKYSLASKNLPHETVSKVEVLENHQPIKMLDTIEFSNKTSVNLKLKNDITLTGECKLGGGFSPFLWDFNVSPMLFSKNQQVLTSLQSNNFGNILKVQTFDLYNLNKQDQINNNFLSLKKISRPSIDKNLYIDNKSHLATYNHLFKLKGEKILKLNSYYYYEKLKEQASIENIFYQSTETLQFDEKINNSIKDVRFGIDVIYEENSDEIYFKNKANLVVDKSENFSEVVEANRLVLQEIDKPFISFNNNLDYRFKLKRRIFKVSSNNKIEEFPQYLYVMPGVFTNILSSPSSTKQLLTFKQIESKNSLGNSISVKNWLFNTDLKFDFNRQSFDSNFENLKLNKSDYRNNLTADNLWIIINEKISYKLNNLNLTINLPIVYRYAYNIDKNTQIDKEKSNIYINPSLYINYQISGYLSTVLTLRNKDTWINNWTSYQNLFLSDYKTLNKKNIPIMLKRNNSINYYLKYKNPLRNLFANINFSALVDNKNYIRKISVDKKGALLINYIEKDNSSKNFSLNTTFHKIFYNPSIGFKLNGSIGKYLSDVIINNNIDQQKTDFLVIEPKISFTEIEWLDFDIVYSYMYQKVQYYNQKENTNRYQEIVTNFNIIPALNHFINFEYQAYIYQPQNFKQKNINIANVTYKYTIKKSNIEFIAQLKNLFNEEYFQNTSNTSYSTYTNQYAIRKRAFLLSIRFSL